MNDWIQIAIWAAIIGGAFGVLWYFGHVQRLTVYVQQTREELKKCSWPTWGELKASTVLIIVMIALLGVFVVAIDRVLFSIFIR